MTEIRVYADIHADTIAVPTDQQWRDLAKTAKEKPLSAGILAAARAAHNRVTMHKRSQGAGQVNRHAMLSFEIRSEDRASLVALLDEEATARSVTGTNRQKFDGVLTAELQEAATDLGFGAQASNISVTLVAIGLRDNAKATAQAYLAANTAVWHE